jgi:hypothetical protein
MEGPKTGIKTEDGAIPTWKYFTVLQPLSYKQHHPSLLRATLRPAYLEIL